jgi:hypothetical protein
MTPKGAAALLSSLLTLLLLAAPAGAEVRERILAVVDDRPILLTEVRVVERVLGLDTPGALEKLIDEWLMFREAARIPQAAVAAEEEEQALRGLLQSRPDLEGAVAEADLRRLARRQSAILKYVNFRFRAQIRIGDDRVRQAYEDEYRGRPAPPLAEVEEALRERLARRDLSERIEAWVKELRAAAEIRYNP